MSSPWSEAKLAIAKLVAPLSLWMAAGWAAYPYATEYLAKLSEESDDINMPEIRSFSIAAVLACLMVSTLAAGYCFALRGKPSDVQAPPPARCPYCDTDNPAASAACAICGRRLA